MIRPTTPDDAVIVAYARTAFGRARRGSLAGERPEDLALTAVRGVLDAVPALDPDELDDLVLGTAMPEGSQGDNIARRIALLAGLDAVPGYTINRYCASSLEAAAGAARAIRAGDGQAYLIGGVESTSSQPPVIADPYPGLEAAAERTEHLLRSGGSWSDPRDSGLMPDLYVSMGATAEFVARSAGVTRADQDEWALHSQRRATRSVESGYFAREIVEHVLKDGTRVDTDDGPRPSTTAEGLASLDPVFSEQGTVTAGNASPLNDGASAAVLMSARRASELGLTPLARILGAGATGLSPEIMGLGPIEASRRLLDRLGLTVADIDIIELNEAFAAQVVPITRALRADPERVNPHGGAIAIGHPFGATGVRLMGTLTNGLRATGGSLGLATLCVGGGQGMALALERLS